MSVSVCVYKIIAWWIATETDAGMLEKERQGVWENKNETICSINLNVDIDINIHKINQQVSVYDSFI